MVWLVLGVLGIMEEKKLFKVVFGRWKEINHEMKVVDEKEWVRKRKE